MPDLIDTGHTCSICGKPIMREPDSISTGYGVNAKGDKVCFACCADTDRANMIETGRATLYLVLDPGHVQRPYRFGFGQHGEHRLTNWPGSLSFGVPFVHMGRHNMAGRRYDCDFTGPDGFIWHATQYGDNTQIAHCRRTKARA